MRFVYRLPRSVQFAIAWRFAPDGQGSRLAFGMRSRGNSYAISADSASFEGGERWGSEIKGDVGAPSPREIAITAARCTDVIPVYFLRDLSRVCVCKSFSLIRDAADSRSVRERIRTRPVGKPHPFFAEDIRNYSRGAKKWIHNGCLLRANDIFIFCISYCNPFVFVIYFIPNFKYLNFFVIFRYFFSQHMNVINHIYMCGPLCN